MLRQRTPIDGMMRTMVITCETSKARTIVLPLWFIPQASKDILRGTDIRADATLDAQPTVHNELFIGDKMLLEEAAKKPGVDTRPMPNNEVAGRSVVDDIVYIITQFGSSLVSLFLLLISIVDIKNGSPRYDSGMMSENTASSAIPLAFKSLRRISIVSPMLSPAVQSA